MKPMIARFVVELSSYTQFESVENQYSSSFQFHDITSSNLKLYLKTMLLQKPDTILIGEAPGYKGCRWTGIPFTSERVLLSENKEICLFGLDNGYRIRDIKRPQAEATATIMWSCLATLNVYPLLWNVFPFHPHLPSKLDSNRKPSSTELEVGTKILQELLDMFQIDKVVAIGNVAYKALTSMNIQSTKIRHPANGGKSDFIKGLSHELMMR